MEIWECVKETKTRPKSGYHFLGTYQYFPLLECKIGTTTREDGGQCLPCKYNMYGVLCSETCDCYPYERYVSRLQPKQNKKYKKDSIVGTEIK